MYLRKNISGTYASMWVGEGGCRSRMFKPSGQCMWAVNCVNDSTHMFFWHSRPSGEPPSPPPDPSHCCVCGMKLIQESFQDTDLMESVFPDKQGLCYVSLWLNLQILVQTASRRWSSGFESCWWTESWGATHAVISTTWELLVHTNILFPKAYSTLIQNVFIT